MNGTKTVTHKPTGQLINGAWTKKRVYMRRLYVVDLIRYRKSRQGGLRQG